MTDPIDNSVPALLSHAGHEFRNSLAVVAGYTRMLLQERVGPLNDMQRRNLKEIEKACNKQLVLLAEISDVGNMEAGKTTLKSSPIDLHRVLTDAIATTPEIPDRPIEIVLNTVDGQTAMVGDEPRLKVAFASVFWALGREISATQLVVRYRPAEFRGKPANWIAVGAPEDIEELESATPDTLTVFKECRGGCGLSLSVARWVITGHGGALWSPGQGTKAGAVVALPRSS
jgi:signal transduction histidine kinase